MSDERPAEEGEVIGDGEGGSFKVPSYKGSVPRDASLSAPGREGASIGLSYLEAGGEVFITAVDSGGAAAKAGVPPGSKMLAINGIILNSGSHQQVIIQQIRSSKEAGKGIIIRHLPPEGSDMGGGVREGEIVEYDGKTFSVPAYANHIHDAVLNPAAVGLSFVNVAGSALVSEVVSGGEAERAGIPPTSRIKALNGVPIGGPNVHEQVTGQVQASLNAGKSLVFTFQPPQGAQISSAQLDGSDDDSATYSYSEGTTIDPERQHLMDKLSPMIMKRFDVDKDKLLSFREYSELNRIFRRQQVSKEAYKADFPKGFTRLNLYEELSVYSREDLEHLLRILEKGKYAPTTTSGRSGHSDRSVSSSSLSRSLDVQKTDSGDGFEDFDVTQAYPTRDRNEAIGVGPYPSIWKLNSQDKTTNPNIIDRFVRVDLRSDNNTALKNALLLMGRELENRLAESVESHTMLENALDALNGEAVGRFGHDLETLLARPEKRGEANAWAGARMREIPLPARLIRSYEMAGGAAGVLKNMREEEEIPPSTASTLSSGRSRRMRPAPRGPTRYRRRDRIPWQTSLI